ENTGSGPITFDGLNYPEYIQGSWHFPDGDLRVDSRHKIRVWGIYDILDTKRHKLNVSLLQNYFAGQPYGANTTINPSSFVTNPGYRTPTTSETYYFTARDAFHTDDITRTDLSFNYSFNIPIRGRDIEIFIQPEVINLFNEQGVIDPQGLDDDEGVTVLRGRLVDPANPAAGTRQFNPFTETPQEGVDYRLSDTFGQPLNEGDFQQERTFRFSVGVRF
ncbi:MAG: hypothetical protein KDD47_00070, partial [Acidobacteria bacterium]|nr:hypothetical protein [Acidobacteriota bacterium]